MSVGGKNIKKGMRKRSKCERKRKNKVLLKMEVKKSKINEVCNYSENECRNSNDRIKISGFSQGEEYLSGIKIKKNTDSYLEIP
jgi:hypothetical protein